METWDWKLHPTLEGALQGIDQLSCGVLVEDREGLIHYANRRILELTGYEAHELDGRPISMLVPDELHEQLAVEQTRTQAGDARTRLSVLRRKDGRTLPVAVSPHWIEKTPRGDAAVVSVVIDLGEIQTARPMGAPDGSLAAELASVATRLQSLSFSASLSGRSDVPIDDPTLQTLSAREREILSLLMRSLRVPAIAERLFIAQSTVRNHLKAIYRKLGVSSQRELIDRIGALTPSDRRSGAVAVHTTSARHARGSGASGRTAENDAFRSTD